MSGWIPPLPSFPSSLVKPHNLPITRIAPSDATSYQKTQRSTPSKLSGNRSTVRIYRGSDSISHDRSKKYFDEMPGVNGYQRLVQTTLSGGSMVDIHVQHWFIFICRDRALECLRKEKRLTLVAKKCWQRSIDRLLASGLAEVGNNLNGRWQLLPGKKSVQKVSVCPKFLLTSLYDECGAIFLRRKNLRQSV